MAALGRTVAPSRWAGAPRLHWVSAHGPVLKRREGLRLQTRKLRLRQTLVHSGPDLCQAQADPQGVVLQRAFVGGHSWRGASVQTHGERGTFPCKLSVVEVGAVSREEAGG